MRREAIAGVAEDPQPAKRQHAAIYYDGDLRSPKEEKPFVDHANYS
jgi:hypothetical protein